MPKLLLLLALLCTQAFAGGINRDPGAVGNFGGFQGTSDVSYTPTLSAGFGTPTNVNFFWRRDGDHLIVHGTFTAGTVAASLGTISLPSGLAIDTTKLLAASTAGPCPAVGEYQTNDANQHGSMLACTSTSTTVVYNSLNFVNDGHLTPNNANGSFTSNHVATIHFAVPISGWSAGGAGGGVLDSSLELNNLGIAASVGSSALTVSLKQRNGNDPDSTNPVKIAFRNATATTGDYTERSVTSALSITASSGSTLGCTSAQPCRVYVWAIDSGSGVVLGISGCAIPKDNSILSTTAEGGAGAADAKCTIYTSSAQTSKPARLIGRITSTQATAGTWATAPSALQLMPFEIGPRHVSFSIVTSTGAVDDYSGLGITGSSTGSGGATVTWPSGTWNNTNYVCTCTSMGGGDRYCNTGSYAIGTMAVQHANQAGGTDGTVAMICEGY